MRWKANEEPPMDPSPQWRVTTALIPIQIGDEYVWLEDVEYRWIGFEEAQKRGSICPWEYRNIPESGTK